MVYLRTQNEAWGQKLKAQFWPRETSSPNTLNFPSRDPCDRTAQEILKKGLNGAEIFSANHYIDRTFSSKVVWKCLTWLQIVRKYSKFILMWVPGHGWRQGWLAIETVLPPFGLEPQSVHPKAYRKQDWINTWTKKWQHWVNSPGAKLSN